MNFIIFNDTYFILNRLTNILTSIGFFQALSTRPLKQSYLLNLNNFSITCSILDPKILLGYGSVWARTLFQRETSQPRSLQKRFSGGHLFSSTFYYYRDLVCFDTFYQLFYPRETFCQKLSPEFCITYQSKVNFRSI